MFKDPSRIPQNNPAVGFQPAMEADFSQYAYGYLQAARSWTGLILDKEGLNDAEAYPAFFLYRHAFELALKGFVRDIANLVAADMGPPINWKGFLRDHTLVKPANIVCEFLQDTGGKNPSTEAFADQIKDAAADFYDLDRHSFVYRFPTDNSGKPARESQQLFNLLDMYQKLTPVIERLIRSSEYVAMAANRLSESYQSRYAVMIRDLFKSVGWSDWE